MILCSLQGAHVEIGYSQPSVQQLFTVMYQYRIPPYQRGYAWELRHVDDFWNDISTVGSHGHFLGPVVLHASDDDMRDVIDGQQRLTTLQMLLSLIRDHYVEHGDPQIQGGDGDRRSAAPQSLVRQAGYSTRFRLHSGDSTRAVLEDFILRKPDDPLRKWTNNRQQMASLTKVERARNKALLEAYARLNELLRRYEADGPDPVHQLATLEDALVRKVSLVVLDLQNLEDAFLLFETLNDRGLRLSAADLLKSHLLAKFDARHPGEGEALEEAADKWDDMVDRLGGGDISGFLRHYLLLSHDGIKKADVFKTFKSDVANSGPEKALKELSDMGTAYAELVRPVRDESNLSSVLLDRIGTSVDSHRIALMPARLYLPESDFVRFARLAEILSFRWVVTGGNAQQLEEVYQDAAQLLHSSKGARAQEAEQLVRTSFPSDDAFRSAFEREALGYEYVAAYALRKIENYLDGAEKTIKPAQDVHVEHIMPKTATDFWRERVPEDVAYEEAVSRWGNLTLLLARLNSSISNGDWSAKRFGNGANAGYGDSKVVLTSGLIGLEDWRYESIAIRAKWLAELAVRVWATEPAQGRLPSVQDAILDPTVLAPVQT